MWKHEILGDLCSSKNNLVTLLLKDTEIIFIKNMIQKSIVFHIGDINTQSLENIEIKEKLGWFMSKNTANRLPFEYTIFEHYDKVDDSGKLDKNGKCVLLCHQLNNEIILVYSIVKNISYDLFTVIPSFSVVKVGSLLNSNDLNIIKSKSIYNNDTNLEIVSKNYEQYNSNVCNIPFGKKPTRFDDGVLYDVPFLGSFLMLLNCKNISTEEIQRPEKVNKKRIKKGLLPLYSYHVLNVDLSCGGKKRIGPIVSSDIHQRLHFQRGHFKQYMEDNKLFGKHTGLYWWQPHLRGTNKDGFVDKEYHINNEKEIKKDRLNYEYGLCSPPK